MTRAEADKCLKEVIARMVQDGIDRETLEGALAGVLVASKADAFRTTPQDRPVGIIQQPRRAPWT